MRILFGIGLCAILVASVSTQGDNGLKWETVGSDRFVVLNSVLIWDGALQECIKLGLQLYRPRNSVAVADFLERNYEDHGFGYWLGAQGSGRDIRWLSGEKVSEREPWVFSEHCGRKCGTNTHCLECIGDCKTCYKAYDRVETKNGMVLSDDRLKIKMKGVLYMQTKWAPPEKRGLCGYS